MTESSSVRTTMTTIYGGVTVDQNFEEGGGIKIVTGQILMGSMETQLMAKGSIGNIGKIIITQ